MNARRVEPQLTPQAQLERAKRRIGDAVLEIVQATIRQGLAESEWVDQESSPLGRRRHLELARRKVLRSTKEGRRVLIRRDDLNAYLESKGLASARTDEEDEGAVLDRIVRGGTT